MEIKIRRAVKEDCPRLWNWSGNWPCTKKHPNRLLSRRNISLKAVLAKNRFGGPLWPPSPTSSPTGERIDGFALYYIRYSTWKGQAMYLEDILVTESQRGKGIGFMLFSD